MLPIYSTVKLILSILALLLFVFGYQICSVFYDPCTDIVKWYDMRFNLYAFVLFLCFIIALPKEGSKLMKFVLLVGIGLSTADVIDRLFFDITKFTREDIVMIFATLVISYFETYTQLLTHFQKLCQRTKLKP